MLQRYFQLLHYNIRRLGQMLEYIIDLKQISKYKAANFSIDLKGQNT